MRAWAHTESKASSAKAAWAKSIARWTRDWAAPSRSRSCSEQFIERFKREARAISSLNHPNICTLYDVGPNYLVMELVEGETMAARLKTGPVPVETALQYACADPAALAEAHEKGIVHRDLKPGNIMIAKSGIKVLDFGLAKSGQDDTVTASHMVMGTPAYMAPEQREGKPADARSDIYSFGCVLYEMLTGVRAAFQRRRIAVAEAGKNRKPLSGRGEFAPVAIRCGTSKGTIRRNRSPRAKETQCQRGRLTFVGIFFFRSRRPAHGQEHGRSCRFREYHGRFRVRFVAARDSGGTIGAFPGSISACRPAREPDAEPDV